MAIIETEFRFTGNNANLTAADGTANTRSKIYEFTVPSKSIYQIRPADILSAYLASSTPTEIANTSRVELIHSDAAGIVTKAIFSGSYTIVTAWVDRNSLYALGMPELLDEDSLLQLYVTADLAISTADSMVQISALRVAETIAL